MSINASVANFVHVHLPTPKQSLPAAAEQPAPLLASVLSLLTGYHHLPYFLDRKYVCMTSPDLVSAETCRCLDVAISSRTPEAVGLLTASGVIQYLQLASANVVDESM
jgi:hypothetical protein